MNMSRVGKEPVAIPPKVEVKQIGDKIEVKGPLGVLHTPIYSGIELKVEDNLAKFSRVKEEKETSKIIINLFFF